MRYIKLFLLMLLRAYKKWISPLLGERCRFYPSCSDYMYEAITRHGIAKGIALGSYRLLRCNPLCKGGYDPVP
ncbi:MAG: membrane protein insertion efficiency factor YidD [Firmicutes bacterium]|nr:membrane protein insertion efficiency factor YidD [Bacillota bacterium]